MNGKDEEILYAMLERQINIFRFAAGERQKVLRILQRLEDDLVELLFYSGKKLTDTGRADRARLLAQAQKVISDYYGQARDEFAESMVGLARVEGEATAKSMGVALQSAIVPALPTETFFKTLVADTLIQGAPSATWWNRQGADLAFRFANEVRQGLAQAETNDQIIRRIRGNATSWRMVDGKRVYTYTGGVMDTARRNAAALVQTSVQTVANAARYETFNANDDMIAAWQQVSTLDSKTTLMCVARDGLEWRKVGDRMEPIGHNIKFERVPLHWNCRSVHVPRTKTFKEMGIDLPEPPRSTRASTDGQQSAGTDFDAFLKRKPAAFADDLLGPGRAELWRDKKITLQQLLDQSGRPLTLAELRAKYE